MSSEKELDRAVEIAQDSSRGFAKLSLQERVQLLRQCMERLGTVAEAWAEDGQKAKQLPDPGEEWLSGLAPTMRNLRLLAERLRYLERHAPAADLKWKALPDGRGSVPVFPASSLDAALFAGFSVEQHLLPEAKQIEAATLYQEGGRFKEAVSLILGAGNVSSIPPMDALYKSFVEGYTTVVKMNPINSWVGPHLERAFSPLIDSGFMQIVYGGKDEGRYLVEHPQVQDIHITGSNHSHDMIVWGPPGAERERRLKENDPVLKKSISSELGNVSPVVIVPDRYTPKEIRFMAENVAAMLVNNASFNCNAAKLLVTSKQWGNRDAFFRALSDVLRRIPSRYAYYPGARARFESLTEGRSEVERYGEETEFHLPWTLIRNVEATNADDPIFSTEPFCSILSETTLDGADPVAFLEAATGFLNETLWGTLNAMLVVSPRLSADKDLGDALERSICTLRYGTVSVNHWPALAYGLTTPAWGGHPSSRLDDIQSGLGWVHNTYMLENIEKTVVRGPFQVYPKPLWFADHKKVVEMGRRLFWLERNPGWSKVPGLLFQAIRG